MDRIPDDIDAFQAALREEFIAFLQKSFPTASGGGTYVHNWHIDAIAHDLEAIRSGDNTRLIVTMPPRYLKSITVSVAWVAWMLGKDPELKFACISYSADLALKHARDCRAIMMSDWYREIFPKTRLAGRTGGADMNFRTTKGGGRFSTSVGGTMTGLGGDIIIIDDPINAKEAASPVARETVKNWYSGTLSTRLNDKKTGSVILVMQRLHEDDLAGHLMEAGGWKHLSLPAISEADEVISLGHGRQKLRRIGDVLHPEREDLAQLEAQRAVMGSVAFNAQYQQAPVPAEGQFVKRDWLARYTAAPQLQPGDTIVQSWDTASKDKLENDWSVCITALKRGRLLYILDVFRARLTFPDLKRRLEELVSRWNVQCLLVEDAASGQQLIQQLRHENRPHIPRPIACTPEGSKLQRFLTQTPKIEAGEVLLPEEAPWLAVFEREILGFPTSRHDDQADALAQLLAWAETRWEPGIGAAPQVFRLDGSPYVGDDEYDLSWYDSESRYSVLD
jgi:predicted phage terminase large subunit-like protein